VLPAAEIGEENNLVNSEIKIEEETPVTDTATVTKDETVNEEENSAIPKEEVSKDSTKLEKQLKAGTPKDNSKEDNNKEDSNKEDINKEAEEEESGDAPTKGKTVSALAGSYVNDGAIIKEYSTSVTDGVAPFDDDNDPGNDKDAYNKIVRTFDSVTYGFNFTVISRGGTYPNDYADGRLYIEYTLNFPKDKAEFDLASMPWLQNPVVTISGQKQILTGYRELPASSGVAIPGSGSVNAIIKVLGALNGDDLEPIFKLWMDGNVEDPDTGLAFDAVHDDDYVRIVGDPVKVSSAPSYNIRLLKNGYLAYLDSFDFNTGQAATVASDPLDVVFGRMYGFGLTLQLYNTDPQKGLKGVELPVGPFEFDIDLTLKRTKSGTTEDITQTNPPLLWDYKPSTAPVNDGILGRYNNWVVESGHSTGVAPLIKTASSAVIDSATINNKPGTWTAAQTGGTVHVVVDGFDFSWANSFVFPTRNLYSEANTIGANIGCFSAGYFEILAPLPEAGYDYTLTVADSGMDAKSVTGQTATNADQVQKTDDSINISVPYQLPGSYSLGLYLDKASSTSHGSAGYITSTPYEGDAWRPLEGEFRAWPTIWISSNNDAVSFPHAINDFIKFDDRAFEIPPNAPNPVILSTASSSTMPWKALFVAKADKTGWASETEMQASREDDANLVYFETLAELNTGGYTCIGVLVEGREGIVEAGTHYSHGLLLRAKDNADNIGKVFQIIQSVRLWTADNPLTFDYTRMDPDTVYPLSKWTASPNYVKSAYDASGQVIAGTHSGNGNSVLIIGYTSEVDIAVAQLDGSSNEKKVFDLDAVQRRADFTVSSRLAYAKSGDTSTDSYTKAYVTVTLPEELHYVYGSSALGGAYVQGTPQSDSTGGHLTGGAPTSGTAEDPEITGNPDGTTTLVWTLDHQLVGAALPDIHFSATIGTPADQSTDVTNSQSFKVRAIIQADLDGRRILPINGNIDEAGIQVIKLGSTQLSKTVKKPMLELNEDPRFEINYTNQSTTPLTDFRFLDVLPYNGDNRFTSYNGTWTLPQVNVDVSSPGASSLALYYTTDSAARLLNANAPALTFTGTGWTAAYNTGTSDEMKFILPANTSPAAIALVGTLAGGAGITIDYTMDQTGSKPGDAFGNTASVYANGLPGVIPAAMVQALYVGRTISGLAWNDKDANGKQDAGEPKLVNTPVKLWKDGGAGSFSQVTTDILGDSLPTATDADGAYLFEKLPPGDYVVEFAPASADRYILSEYQAAGTSTEDDSDAQVDAASKIAAGAYITDTITLPTAAALTANPIFKSEHNDAGFYQVGSLTINKVLGTYAAEWDATDATPYTVKIQLASGGTDEYLTFTGAGTISDPYTYGASTADLADATELVITKDTPVIIEGLLKDLELKVIETVTVGSDNFTPAYTYSNGAGKVTIVANSGANSDANSATVTNNYPTPTGSAGFRAQKIAEGFDLEDEQFTFNLQKANANGAVSGPITSVKNDPAGEINFENLPLTGLNNYFVISEAGKSPSWEWTYDDAKYQVNLKATVSGGVYSLESIEFRKFTGTAPTGAWIVLDYEGSEDSPVSLPEFTNVYDDTIQPVLSVEIDKDTIKRTSAAYESLPGKEGFNNVGKADEHFRYDINFRSTSNVGADEFVIDDPLEAVSQGQIRVEEILTPIVTGDRDGLLNVWYKTNKTKDTEVYSNVKAADITGIPKYANTGFKLWKQGISTGERTLLKAADIVGDGEYITAIRLEYGGVEEGFTSRDTAGYSLNDGKTVDWTPTLKSTKNKVSTFASANLQPISYLVSATHAMQDEDIVSSATARISLGELEAKHQDSVKTKVIKTFSTEPEEYDVDSKIEKNSFTDNAKSSGVTLKGGKALGKDGAELNTTGKGDKGSSAGNGSGNATTPTTGDDFAPLLLLMGLAISLSGIIVVIVSYRRKKKARDFAAGGAK
jgi:LPXTG-motif cell wall-anchored protein